MLRTLGPAKNARMSRITDAVDGAGGPESPIPTRSSFVVAGDPARAERVAAVLRADSPLDEALALAFDAGDVVELVGFSAADAEPFAVGPLPLERAVHEARDRFRDGGAGDTALEPLWPAHRGHVVWVHPGTVASARLTLALSLVEFADAARMLGTHAARLAQATTGLANRADLEAALSDEARADVLDAIEALDETHERAPVPVPLDPSAIVLVHARGDALVARIAGPTTALGFVERGGRPYLLPRTSPSVHGWLTLLHSAIDRDAPTAEVLASTEGARIDGDSEPDLVASEGAAIVAG